MKVTITAEIDNEEAQGIDPAIIAAAIRQELDGWEFWPRSSDGLALFGIKVEVSDAA